VEIKEALKRYMTAASPAPAITTPIHYTRAPQGISPPYIVLSTISATRSHSYGGDSGFVAYRIQASCFAVSETAAVTVAKSVRLKLQNYINGNSAVKMGGTGGLWVQDILLDGELCFYEDDTKLFHIPLDFIVSHYEKMT
jgi:hypothetical protein